jgi:DNA-binding transcriptional MerR regulator
MTPAGDRSLLRIGELSRRTGVSDHVLRAWELRYGLLHPIRSTGGYRLYTEDDAARIRRMQAHLGSGLSAAQAAKAVLDADAGNVGQASAGAVEAWVDELADALERSDEPAGQAVLDQALTVLTVEGVLGDLVLPVLRRIGDRWEAGEITVAQEHFASHVLRGRLSGMARGWGRGHGPIAVLACPPGERHDIALMAFGIALNRCGWRIHYLGADTPIADLASAITEVQPTLTVLSANDPARLSAVATALVKLPEGGRLLLAGPGATQSVGRRIGVQVSTEGPVSAAQAVAAEIAGTR